MAVRDFADIYTWSPRAAGPKDKVACVYISKIPMQPWYQLIYTTPTQRAFIYKAHLTLLHKNDDRKVSRMLYNIFS